VTSESQIHPPWMNSSTDAGQSARWARELVFNWSAWISSQTDTAASAWNISSNKTVGKNVTGLPFPAWDALWTRWQKERKKNGTTQEASATFKYIDRLDKEDNLVSKPEFTTAYNLAATELAIFPYCVSLHDRFWNSSQAWATTAAGRLNKSRWSLVWAKYVPPFNFSKPSSAESFHFLDADVDGNISKSEFDWIFGLCENTPTTTSSSSSSSSSNTTTTSKIVENSVKVQVSSTTSMATAATSTPPMRRCCYEVSAECLSCLAGITAQELCSSSSMSLTPGCPGAPSNAKVQAAPGGPHAHAQLTTLPPHYQEVQESKLADTECPYSGVAFSPALPGFNESKKDGIASCQAMCAQTSGCGYFTFWRASGFCSLHPLLAFASRAPEAVGGPAVCFARFEAHIASVDFGQLSEAQLQSLHGSLPETLADALNVPLSKVQDVEGRAGAVTLLPGSLLVQGTVVMPPGKAVEEVEARVDRGKNVELRKAVSNVLLKANVPYVADSDDFQGGFPLHMVIQANTDCFVAQTEFSSAEQAKISASSAAECQQRCDKNAPNCSVFSFFADEHQCYLTGGNFSAFHNEAALSGPATCTTIPFGAAADLPDEVRGRLVAESEAAIAELDRNHWVSLALAALVLGLLALCLARCLRAKPQGKKLAAKWHEEALYLPISKEEEEEAREVRSRPGVTGSSYDWRKLPPSAPQEAFAFHGPDVLSWRQNA
ncbi:unnamed protein product, partial [Effrenium voratum]